MLLDDLDQGVVIAVHIFDILGVCIDKLLLLLGEFIELDFKLIPSLLSILFILVCVLLGLGGLVLDAIDVLLSQVLNFESLFHQVYRTFGAVN